MTANRKALRSQPKGGHTPAGTACLFLFPFDIFHHAAGPPMDGNYQGHRVRVYPPFPNDANGQLEYLQVRLESVPRLPGTTAPHVQAPRIREIRFHSNFANNTVRGDALRIDAFTPAGPVNVSSYVDRLLELIRMLTLQWWITRDRRFDETYFRNTFSINELGERLDGVAVQTMGR